MDYAYELKNLLRPLGIYDLDSGAGAAELDCIGREMDRIFSALETAERDANPLTATADGLKPWETLLPFTPASRTENDRRRAVAALLQIDGGSFTPDGINRTIIGCGICAAVRETGVPMTVEVTFPKTRGVPENFSELQERLEQILPCHLAAEYVFAFCTWLELEDLFESWQVLNRSSISWEELQQLGGTEP